MFPKPLFYSLLCQIFVRKAKELQASAVVCKNIAEVLWSQVKYATGQDHNRARNVVSAEVGFEGSNSRAISGVGAWKNTSRRRSKIHTLDGTKLWAKWSICRKKNALSDIVKSAEIRWWMEETRVSQSEDMWRRFQVDCTWRLSILDTSLCIFGMISTPSLPIIEVILNFFVLILELLPNLEVVPDNFLTCIENLL